MSAVVYATPGSLHLDPTDATTGGTELVGIENESIRVEFAVSREMRRIGLRGGFRVVHQLVGPLRLVVPFRGQSAGVLKILLSEFTTSGTTFQPTGGEALGEFAIGRTFSIVLRPDSTSERYLYAPAWQVDPGSTARLTWSEGEPVLEGSELVLMASGQGVTVGTPAWQWETAANINTTYGLGEGA